MTIVSPDPPAVRVRGLTHSYSAVPALRGIELDVQEGEFVTLLGPSGSGKSTMLHIVAGFQTQSGGDVQIFAKDMSGIPPERRNLGMVFQSYALFPHMSVEENLAFPLRIRKVPRVETDKKVSTMLEVLGLGGFRKRKPRELSGGQQQRIALGRALIFEPKLVLMDEPLGALDRALREQLQAEIKSIMTKQGAATIYVTHDQAEALSMADRVVVMRDGLIEQAAAPQDAYRRPATAFVATFLGRATILDGQVIGLNDSGARLRIEELSDMLVDAEVKHPVALGDRVRVVVRPEDCGVESGTGRSNGTVVHEQFNGATIARTVRISATDLIVEDPQLRSLVGVGAPVDVTLKRAWILPDA